MAKSKKKKSVKAKDKPNKKTYGVRYIARIIRKYAGKKWLADNNVNKTARDILDRIYPRKPTVRLVMSFIRKKKEIEPVFENHIPYYEFKDKVMLPVYDDVKVSITAEINEEKLSFSGVKNDVRVFHLANVFKPLNKDRPSPPPHYLITDTDNKKFVKYDLVFGEEGFPEEKPEQKKPTPTTPAAPVEKKDVSNEIQLEREKQKTAASQEKLRLRDIEFADKIIEMKKQGFSNEDILRFFGK